jgi:hypothetical protein
MAGALLGPGAPPHEDLVLDARGKTRDRRSRDHRRRAAVEDGFERDEILGGPAADPSGNALPTQRGIYRKKGAVRILAPRLPRPNVLGGIRTRTVPRDILLWNTSESDAY